MIDPLGFVRDLDWRRHSDTVFRNTIELGRLI